MSADPAPVRPPAKRYGDWNGPNAPKPLTYSDAPQVGYRGNARYGQPMAAGAATAETTDVVVSPGDTLSSLSRRYGVSVDELRRANAISADRIVTGQHLIVPRRH